MSFLKTKADIFFLGLLIFLWGAFHYRVLFEGSTFVFLDSSSFFFPLWKWGAGVFRSGLLPLWNSRACFGTPYLADPQTASWYPPIPILYCLFNAVTAFNILLLAHHLWAIVGFWFFARGRHYSPVASFLGALVFGFSFQAICLFWACTMLLTFSWIPWVFWTFEEMMKGKRLFFIGFSFAAAMELAAGYPVLFYLTFLILAIDWILSQGMNREGFAWKGFLKGVVLYCLGGALAFLYNMAWIFPFEEFLGLSNAAQRLSSIQSLNLKYFGTFFNPFLMGHPLYSHPTVPLSVSVYFMGLPVVAILLISVWSGKIRNVSGIVFGLTLILSVGHSLRLFDGFRAWVPGYEWVVRSGYMIPLVVFSGAWLFMESISDWMQETDKKNRDYGGWFAICVLVFTFALWLGVPVILYSFWLSLIFLWLVGLKTQYPIALRWLFLFLSMVFSMGPVLLGINFTLNRSYYEKTPAICAYMKTPGRVYFSLKYVMDHMIFSGSSVTKAYEHLNESLNPNRALTWGLEQTMMVNTFFLPSYLRWDFDSFEVSKNFSQKVLNYLDVRYVLGGNSFRSLKHLGNADWLLSENPHPLPKWFSVIQTLPSTDWKIDFYREAEKKFAFQDECLVDNREDVGNYSRRTVEEVFRSPNRIEFQTRGKGKAFLASSETDYPGWSVNTGEGWRPVDDVNHGFRGFVLTDHEKKALLVYRPVSFRMGCFLSLLSISLWVAILLINIFKKDLSVTSSFFNHP